MLPSWLVAVLAQQASGPLIGTGDTRDVHMLPKPGGRKGRRKDGNRPKKKREARADYAKALGADPDEEDGIVGRSALPTYTHARTSSRQPSDSWLTLALET